MSTTLPELGMLPRLREDYNSRKWTYTNRQLVPPSYSRSHLSENLSTSFGSEEQREKWLLMSLGSTASPSRVPPEGITRYNPASPEKKKEIFIENKASYFRIKSCPPDYILNPRYYKNMIRRNKTFGELVGMPTGETYRSFLLGARYADTRFRSGISKRCDHEIEKLAHQTKPLPESAPTVATNTRSGRLYPSKRSQTCMEASRGEPTQQKEPAPSRPTQLPGSASTKRKSSAKRSRQPGKHTPSPIAVISTNSSPSRPRRPLVRSGESPVTSHVELPLEASLAPSKDSAAADRGGSSAGKSEKQELGDDDLEEDSLAKDQENYFISPEAQKLAGKILEESQLEVDEKYGSLNFGEDVTTDGEPAPAETGSASRLNGSRTTPPAVGPVGAVRGSNASTTGSTTSVAAEDTNMASKSSTIFVDMSNLKVQEDR